MGTLTPTIFAPPGPPGTAVYNISAAALISATAKMLLAFVVQSPGTAGSLTFNDCATVAAAGASNQILSIAYSNLSSVLSQFWTIGWPLSTGLVVSAVPTAAVIALLYA